MTQGFLVPGFNKVGQLNLDNQGGIIGPNNDPVINDLITTFTAPGTFTKSPAANTGTVLVVAGGAGTGNRCGGGGAGGTKLVTSHPLPASGVPVTIGAGGSGASFPFSQNPGSATTFGATSPISTTGGGKGGVRPYPPGQNSNPNSAGSPGGSGGGGGRGFNNQSSAQLAGGSGTPGEGNPGGYGWPDASGRGGGGGGAGAAGVGPSGGGGGPGAGGDGLNISTYFPGYGVLDPDGNYYVAGGGQGSPGPGGKGGGGGDGVSGTTNSGGGGGSSYNNPGGAGGSGFVAVNQPKAGPSRSSGVWTLAAQYTAKINGNWPS